MNTFTLMEPTGRRHYNRLFIILLHVALVVIVFSAIAAAAITA